MDGESWLRTTLQLRPEDQFHLYRNQKDPLGFTHYRYRQYYAGIPVLDGVYYLHYQGQALHSANGFYFSQIQLNVSPAIDEAAALLAVHQSLGAKQYGWDSLPLPQPQAQGALWVLVDSLQQAHLTYRFDIKVANPFGRFWVMVDAHTGKVLRQETRIHAAEANGTAETMYRGTRAITTDSIFPTIFRLRDYSRGNGIETYDLNNAYSLGQAVDFLDTDNYWDDTQNNDQAGYDCHWGTQQTYDYFLQEHNLNSYDGNGAPLISYVYRGNNYSSAMWNGSS
ncbi:MAG: hypothetical protein AAFV07_04330, partial [Bacteroidota bacterium]